MYASLRYLSLSDSTVVTFLAPILTDVAGKVFLHEPFTLKQALAGRESVHISHPSQVHLGKRS
jgi:drug/metabolite transporter (DMT)-like permease